MLSQCRFNESQKRNQIMYTKKIKQHQQQQIPTKKVEKAHWRKLRKVFFRLLAKSQCINSLQIPLQSHFKTGETALFLCHLSSLSTCSKPISIVLGAAFYQTSAACFSHSTVISLSFPSPTCCSLWKTQIWAGRVTVSNLFLS